MTKLTKVTAFFAPILIFIAGCSLLQEKTVSSSKASSMETVTPTVAASTSSPLLASKDDGKNNEDFGEDINSFKPKDWFVLTESDGDVDGDGREDIIALYSKDNPKIDKVEIADSNDGEAERLFVIALKDANGGFKKVFSGSKIVLCRFCGGMLNNVIPEIKIINRKIYVNQSVLAVNEVEYTIEIAFNEKKEFVITKGSIKSKERRTGKIKKEAIKTPMPLNDFNINNY